MSAHIFEGKLSIEPWDGSYYAVVPDGGPSASPTDALDEYDGKRIRVTVLVQDLDGETAPDFGEVSDGFHTFNELYRYRLLYNAALFNEWAASGRYDVHKSRLHDDGTVPFGNPDLFKVTAQLPTGQISNHYPMNCWSLFNIPERERSAVWDGSTAAQVADSLARFLGEFQ